ncbi:MAG: GNAT family N-acetyltransferase [Acidimicrobiales bacterium]
MSQIDEFTAADQAEVRSLILRGLADHWGEIDETLNPDLDDVLANYGHGRTIVVREGDEIIGTGTIVPLEDGRAEIVRMSVDTVSRRSGVGREIVEVLLDTAREWDVRTVVLETTSTWTDVVAFYLSCDFRITHTIDGDFGSDTWFVRAV